MSAAYIPQCTKGAQDLRGPLTAWALAAALMLLLGGLIVVAPWSAAHGHLFAARGIYQSFAYVCHQIPERSFYVAGYPLAVCARCTGLYAGLAAGILLYPLARSLRSTETPARIWLFIAAAPMAVDFSLGFLGLWENTHLSRSLTGALFGLVAALFIVPGLVDLSRTDWRRFFKREAAAESQREPEREEAAAGRAAATASDYSWPSSRI
jgi:uncharacterized membrane protein